MKKLLFALVLGLLLVAALATVAMADNGPHGGFTATTDACANCHRAHSAQFGSNALLVMNSEEALCLSCHDGAGAGTNVAMGVYSQAGSDAFSGVAGSRVEGVDGASLFGGGFEDALMAHTWSGATAANAGFNATSEATTSTHGSGAGLTWQLGVNGTVWGSGANNTANAVMVLECTSCHNPHGTSGYTNATTQSSTCNLTLLASSPSTEACTVKVASYRLLRWQPSGSSGFTTVGANVNWSGGTFPSNGSTTGWTVPDNFATNGTEWYTIGTQTGLNTCGQSGTAACGVPFAAGDYAAGNVEIVYQPSDGTVTKNYRPAANNASYFCAQCHDRYFNNSSLRSATDQSVYCGSPVAGNIVNGVTLPVFAETAPGSGISSKDAVNCIAAYNPVGGALYRWLDNSPSGDSTYMYRHSSGDVLRASSDGTVAATTSSFRVARSCMACHVSHGTSASMTAKAAGASLATGSTLLRMDNRSMCLRCHASNVNFTLAP